MVRGRLYNHNICTICAPHVELYAAACQPMDRHSVGQTVPNLSRLLLLFLLDAPRNLCVCHTHNNNNSNWHNLFSDGAGMNLCAKRPEEDTLMLPSGTEIEVKPPESCLWPNAMQVSRVLSTSYGYRGGKSFFRELWEHHH